MKVATKSSDICSALFNKIEKPSGYLFCNAINVFDNRYRINVFSKRYVEGIEGRHISYSCFAIFNDKTGELNIIS
jgi:hypothetical protein